MDEPKVDPRFKIRRASWSREEEASAIPKTANNNSHHNFIVKRIQIYG
jgi:hypothetical protein